MASLHRTPVHHEALRLIVGELITWRPGKTASGGWFTYVNGQLANQELLVALWELLHARLIEKRGEAVALTDTGRARLSEWDATRAGAQ
jgi:hypothetical protein